MEFQFGMSKCRRQMVVVAIHNVNVLMPLNHMLKNGKNGKFDVMYIFPQNILKVTLAASCKEFQ